MINFLALAPPPPAESMLNTVGKLPPFCRIQVANPHRVAPLLIGPSGIARQSSVQASIGKSLALEAATGLLASVACTAATLLFKTSGMLEYPLPVMTPSATLSQDETAPLVAEEALNGVGVSTFAPFWQTTSNVMAACDVEAPLLTKRTAMIPGAGTNAAPSHDMFAVRLACGDREMTSLILQFGPRVGTNEPVAVAVAVAAIAVDAIERVPLTPRMTPEGEERSLMGSASHSACRGE